MLPKEGEVIVVKPAELRKRVAEVEWEDSACIHGWAEKVSDTAYHAIFSVGYVAKDDEEGVVLVEFVNTEAATTHPYGCNILIPRSAVRKVRYLRK